MNEQPKWYILHTYSGYESMVKDSLENDIFPYFNQVTSPQELLKFLRGKPKATVRRYISCTPYLYNKLCAYTYASVHDSRGAMRYISKAKKELEKARYYTCKVRERESDEMRMLEELCRSPLKLQQDFFDKTIDHIKSNFCFEVADIGTSN